MHMLMQCNDHFFVLKYFFYHFALQQCPKKQSLFEQQFSLIAHIQSIYFISQQLIKLHSNMGNSHQNSLTSKNFNVQDWEVTDRSGSDQSPTGTFKILKHIHTGQCIDQYDLMWPSEEDYKFYLDSYNWRRHQPHIVNSLYLVQNHHSQMCSKSYMAKIYIQHIYTRLSDIKDIPHPDNLYVILSMLEGYQKLYQNLHYFKIQEDQVCIDMEGVVKVWVNSDLSKNYPQGSQFPGQFRNKDESQMVDQIISIIGQNTDHQFQPESFEQFYFNKKGKKRFGFQQAKMVVNEYAKIHHTTIPNKFESILEMMNGDNSNSELDQNSTRNEHQNDDQFNHNFNNPANNQFANINQNHPDNYRPLPVAGGVMPFNQNQPNYGSGVQSGYHSPNYQVYPNSQNQSFQTFYRPQVRAQLYPLNSAGLPIKQFAPVKYQPVNRPVFSIPAQRGVSFSPSSHMVPTKIVSNYPSSSLILQPNNNYQGTNKNQIDQQLRVSNSGHQNHQNDDNQDDYDFQQMDNDREFHQIVSKLNQNDQHSNSQQQGYSHQQNYQQRTNARQNEGNYQYMNDGNEQYDEFPSNHKTNDFGKQNNNQNNVSRSLKINNQNSYNWAGNQNANSRSHIDNQRSGSMLGSGQKLGNLGSVNSSKIRNDKRSASLVSQLKYYYTLDQQLQLDEQIAADLQKYIHAM